MLSYRHSFHAGNYADVLKHIIQIEILSYLVIKDKPFTYIDTHSGAGLYSLTSEQAVKTAEFSEGIGKLKKNDWPELEPYFDVVNNLNSNAELTVYPGSPRIAQHFLREKDRAWLFELHPTDFKILEQSFAKDKRFIVKAEDGHEKLIALLPPISKRGFVLIDPSYEIKNEYDRVVDTLIKAHRRFATGTYALWYPVVDRSRIDRLEKRLVESGIKRIQLFELGQQKDTVERGMTSAGMIVINPPWTLFDKMKKTLPRLATVLGRDDVLVFRCEELVEE